MRQVKQFFLELWLDSRGQGMIEYGLTMSFIAAVILGILSLFS